MRIHEGKFLNRVDDAFHFFNTHHANYLGIKFTLPAGTTLVFYASYDNSTFFTINGTQRSTETEVGSITATDTLLFKVSSYRVVRALLTVGANDGTDVEYAGWSSSANLSEFPESTRITDGVDTALVTTAGGLYTNLAEIVDTTVDVNAGAASAGTQRVISASDDPGVVSLGLLDNTVAVLGTDTYTETSSSGLVIGAVRNDVLAALADTDNEVAPLQVSATGALYVDTSASASTTQNVNLEEVGGTATSVGAGIIDAGCQRVVLPTDQTVLSVNDNGGSLTVDNSTLAVVGGGTEATAMRVTLASDSTGLISVDDNGGSLTVDNADITTLAGVVKTDDAAFTAGTDAVQMVGAVFDDSTPDSVDEGDAGAVRMSANRNLYTTIRDANGSERGANVSSFNALEVDTKYINGVVPSMGVSTNDAGSQRVTIGTDDLLITETTALKTSLQLIDNATEVHDVTIAQTGVLMAGSEVLTGLNTVLADSDASRLVSDSHQRLLVAKIPRADVTHQYTAITSSTAETTILTAAASTYHDVTALTLANRSATDVDVIIKDASVGTTRLRVSVPNKESVHMRFDPPLTQDTLNNNWTATCSGSVDSIDITIVAMQHL